MLIPPLTVFGILLLGAGLCIGYSPAALSDTMSAPATNAIATTGSPAKSGIAIDRNQPIHISADRIEINQKKGIAYYRGHVVFVQGGLRITAAKATARIRDNAVQTIFAEGSPITFFQRAPVPGEDIHGSASRMEYYATEQRLSLYGNVRFQQGSDSMRSATLHYDIAAGTVAAAAGSTQDQVHVVIQPARMPALPPDASPSAPKGHE